MLNIKFLDDIFDRDRKYEIMKQTDDTIVLKDRTSYTQEGTKINALLMQSITDEINQNTPIGVIHTYAGATAPNGYLLCQGQAVSRTTYANLFRIIGTTYGAGDGTTTFTLPNLKSRVPVGYDSSDANFNALGKKGGASSHTLSANEMPSHTHTQNAHAHTGTGASVSAGAHAHTASSNSTGAHTHAVSGTAASAGTHSHLFKYGYGTGPSFVYAAAADNKTTDGTTQVIDSAGAHTHTVSGSAASAGNHAHTITIASNGAHTHGITVSVASITATNNATGGGKAHNNLQPYQVVNYIIKY